MIDTTDPVVSDSRISLSGASGTGGAFKAGDTVIATWAASGGDGDTYMSGATVDFSAFGGGSAVTAINDGTTWSASYPIAPTSANGTNLNVSFTATDLAGNTGSANDSTNAKVDPNPPTILAGDVSISGATGIGGAFKIGDTITATWNGSGNTDISSVGIDFTAFGGGSQSAIYSAGNWTASRTISAGSIDDTNQNVTVTAIDDAGNSTTQADDDNAAVDSIAPNVSVGAISISGSTGNPSGTVFKIGDTVTVEWNASGESDTITSVSMDLSDFGGSATTVASSSGGTWRATYAISSGTIFASNLRVSVTAIDNAGNVTFQVDDSISSGDNYQTPTPSVMQLVPASNSGSTSDSITNVKRPAITGTAEIDSTVHVYVDGVLAGTALANGSGVWIYTFASDLAEGANSIRITATDAVGNTSDLSNAEAITLDTQAPVQPGPPTLETGSNSGDTSDLITNDTSPFVAGTAEANSIIEIFVAGTSVGSNTADGSGDWRFELPHGSLVEGDNAITVTATDSAANTSILSTALALKIDVTDPSIEFDDPIMSDNKISSSEAVAVTISGTSMGVIDGLPVTVTLSDGSKTVSVNTATSNNAWSLVGNTTELADGSITIIAAVSDVATNGSATISKTVSKDTGHPSVVVSGPEDVVTGTFTVNIDFSEAVTGLVLSDINVVEGTPTKLSGEGANYTATIEPIMGKRVQVLVKADATLDAAGNPNTVSNLYEVMAGSPASAFEKYNAEIKQIIVDEAERSLRGTLAGNTRMVRAARDRFIAGQEQRGACDTEQNSVSNLGDTGGSQEQCSAGSGLVSRNVIPFDIVGTAEAAGGRLSTQGSFAQEIGNYEGTSRRLFFGNFDVQIDSDGSSTATISAKVAWERMVSKRTMLGYFFGGELSTSQIDTTFTGSNVRYGASMGGYGVHQLNPSLYLDGFVSIGAGLNSLNMSNNIIALSSEYIAPTATFGGAISGVFKTKHYEIRPELAFSYGKTWLGDIGFTGRAYGLVDDTLSLDAGDVSVVNLTLRPEIIFALDGRDYDESNTLFSFSPRILCEQVRATTVTKVCGGGLEFGLSSATDNGHSSANVRMIVDRVGNDTRSSVQISLERRF